MKRRFPLQPAGLTLAVSLVLASTLTLGACQVKDAAPSVPTVVAAAQDVTLVLQTPRQLLWDANNQLSRADIVHVTLDLVQVDGAGNETAIANLDLDEAELDADVTFSHLRADTHYRVKAKAFGTADLSNLISLDDDRSWTEVQTNTEQAIEIAALKLKLKSVPPLTSGVYVNAAPDLDGGAVDSQGNYYYCERLNHVIRKVAPNQAPPASTTLYAGITGSPGGIDDASNTASTFREPRALAFDASDNLFVADGNFGTSRIRKINAGGGVSTLPGTFGNPRSLAVLPNGSVLVADNDRKIYILSWNGTTYAAPTVFAGSGDDDADEGSLAFAGFRNAVAMAVHPSGAIFVADSSASVIKVIHNNFVRNLRFGPEDSHAENVTGLGIDQAGNLYYSTATGGLRRYTRRGEKQTLPVRTLGGGTQFNTPMPRGFAIGPGRTFYILESNPVGKVYRIQ